MATGTGKTAVAFQLCWKLWSSRWNRTGELPSAAHPVSRRPQHPGRSAEGRDLRGVRGCAVQDRIGRGHPQPGNLFRAVSGARRGRAARGSVQAVRARLLRPHHRRRVPPGQRQGRELLAQHPRVLRARLSARHDGDADAQRQRRHLPVFRQPDLHLQPAAGDRGRVPGAVPRASHHHGMGCGWLAPEQGRAGSVRARDSGRRVPDQGLRAGDCAAGPHGGHRPAPHRVHEEDGSVRQDDRLLRGPGARQRDAAGAA